MILQGILSSQDQNTRPEGQNVPTITINKSKEQFLLMILDPTVRAFLPFFKVDNNAPTACHNTIINIFGAYTNSKINWHQFLSYRLA